MDNLNKFYQEIETIEYRLTSQRHLIEDIECIFKHDIKASLIAELDKDNVGFLMNVEDKPHLPNQIKRIESFKENQELKRERILLDSYRIESVAWLGHYGDILEYTERLKSLTICGISDLINLDANALAIHCKRLNIIKGKLYTLRDDLFNFKQKIIKDKNGDFYNEKAFTIHEVVMYWSEVDSIIRNSFVLRNDYEAYEKTNISHIIFDCDSIVHSRTEAVRYLLEEINKLEISPIILKETEQRKKEKGKQNGGNSVTAITKQECLNTYNKYVKDICQRYKGQQQSKYPKLSEIMRDAINKPNQKSEKQLGRYASDLNLIEKGSDKTLLTYTGQVVRQYCIDNSLNFSWFK